MIFRILALIKFLFHAKTRWHIHSPFVYDFCSQVIRQSGYYDYPEIPETIRQKLLHDDTTIFFTDHGAKGKGKIDRREIRRLARRSLLPVRQCRLLYRLASYLQPDVVLELGTSFGITSMYLADALPHAQIFTIEGCPETLDVAKKNFAHTGFGHISPVEGRFEDRLDEVIGSIARPGLVFIDGNHQYEPTLRYYRTIRPFLSEQGVIVLHDVHWSHEMEKAWKEVLKDPEITLSLDLFRFGIVIFRKGMARQDFVLYA